MNLVDRPCCAMSRGARRAAAALLWSCAAVALPEIARATPVWAGIAPATSVVRDESGRLVRVSGSLSPSDPGFPNQSIGGMIGTFAVESAPNADLRSAPGIAHIDTPAGSLTAVGRSASVPPPPGLGMAALPASSPLPGDEVERMRLNQQMFAMICASSIGAPGSDPNVCKQSVFNSSTPIPQPEPMSMILAPPIGVFARVLYEGLFGAAVANAASPVVLHRNPTTDGGSGFLSASISSTLSDAQEALLGCGPLRGQSSTGCDTLGIDLVGSDPRALMAWLPSSSTSAVADVTPPGARGPWLGDGVSLDPAYDPRIDGCVIGGFDGVAAAGTCAGAFVVHPLTGQPFASELAALSWNFMTLLVALSTPAADGVPGFDELDVANPYRLNGCSFRNPGACRAVLQMGGLAVAPLSDDARSGTRWLWEAGTEWEVTEASGDLAAYQGRSLLAYGPWDAGAGNIGLAFALVPEPTTLLLAGLGLAALGYAGRRPGRKSGSGVR